MARSPARWTTSWSGATTACAAYHLAVVVDDGDTGVDQVVRGDDLLSSAVSQAYLARRLGYPVPTYAHVPLALNREGRRLAKRDGAVTLTDLAAQGRTPAQVWPSSPPRSTCRRWPRLAELLPVFDPARLPREPWVVDPASVNA